MPPPLGDSDYFESTPDQPAHPEDQGGRFCLDCFYSLHGLERVGRCPECGRPYNLNNFYDYSPEPRPPRLRERPWWRRFITFLLAVGLSMLVFIGDTYFCVMLVLYPAWQFSVILAWFIALGLDGAGERLIVCVPAGAVLGVLTLLPAGPHPALILGTICGGVSGFQIHYLKVSGWLD